MLPTPAPTTTPPCPVCGLPPGSCPAALDGICRLVEPPLQAHVDKLLQFRQQSGAIGKPQWHDYNALPHNMADAGFMWRIRCADVRNVLRLLEGRQRQTVIEVGPWNGWLTHHLVRAGHIVTALGYSADGDNGLGAKRHYTVNWHTVQMDVSDLTRVQGKVDVVILNHGLHLFPDALATARDALALIRPGGLVVLLCLMIYRDPSARRVQLTQLEQQCRAAVGVTHLLKPSRGYLTPSDMTALREMGFAVWPYPSMSRSEVKALLRPQAPVYRWGWQQT